MTAAMRVAIGYPSRSDAALTLSTPGVTGPERPEKSNIAVQSTETKKNGM